MLTLSQRLEGGVPRGQVLLKAVVLQLLLELAAVAELADLQGAVLVGDDTGEPYVVQVEE